MLNHQRHCLLVDDDPLDVELARHALHHLAAEVTLSVAHNSAEVVHCLRSWDEHDSLPQCVLLDVHLGVESGMEVLRLLKTNPRWAAMPVVVLSTSQDGRDVRQAYAAGANSYLVKPVAFAQFIDLMRVVLDYWFKHNVTPLA